MGPHYHGPETVPPEEFPEQEEEAGGGEVGFNSIFENNLKLQERLD